MDVNWTELGEFVKTVGIPFAIVLLVLAPIIYAVYWFITKQGPKIVAKHNEFLEKTAAASDRNADSIAMIAATNAASLANHERTHNAIKEVIRGNRKLVERIAPDVAPHVVPHFDRAEMAIEQGE